MRKIDPALFERARHGDREAFWELIVPYRGLVYSVTLSMLKNPEQAEDQMHDALIAAFRSLSNLGHPEKFPSWLYGVARNQCLERIRKERRLRGAIRGAAGELTRVVPIGEWMETERWLGSMEEAMGALPEPFRLALAMKYMNDYSCREMAEILDISVSAVKSRLFEARKLLRSLTRKLADEQEGDSHELS